MRKVLLSTILFVALAQPHYSSAEPLCDSKNSELASALAGIQFDFVSETKRITKSLAVSSDLNRDLKLNHLDVRLLEQNFGTKTVDESGVIDCAAIYDLNNDGIIGLGDFAKFTAISQAYSLKTAKEVKKLLQY